MRKLASLGFLVDYDEHAYLRNRVRLECGNTNALSLTICPTLQCNFACPYCYETARSGKMSPQVQDELVSFARATVERMLMANYDVAEIMYMNGVTYDQVADVALAVGIELPRN